MGLFKLYTLRFITVNGAWSDWTDWSTCSQSCDPGTQTRSRTCDSPTPLYGGADCVGATSESQDCIIVQCPGKLPLYFFRPWSWWSLGDLSPEEVVLCSSSGPRTVWWCPYLLQDICQELTLTIGTSHHYWGLNLDSSIAGPVPYSIYLRGPFNCTLKRGESIEPGTTNSTIGTQYTIHKAFASPHILFDSGWVMVGMGHLVRMYCYLRSRRYSNQV